MLIKLKSYGHALALGILGEEELAKSLLFLLATYDIISEKDTIILQEVIQGPRAHLIKLLLSWVISQASNVITIKQLKQFIAGKTELRNQLKGLLQGEEGEFHQIKQKQQMKLKSLYVDIKEGKVSSPFEIKEQEPVEVLSTLKNRYKILRGMPK